MSVSARTRQYEAMRAVGMEGRQLSRMISAEAYTYAFFGCIFGCGIGLPASQSNIYQTGYSTFWGVILLDSTST